MRPCGPRPNHGAAGVPFPVLTAVLGAAICRSTPLYAAICRPLERKLLIFLGLGFFFASQLRWRSASRAKRARESLPARH